MFYKKMLKQLGLTLGIAVLSLNPIYANEIIPNEEPTLLAEENTAVSSPFKFDHLDYNPDLYAYRVSFSVRFDSSKAGCITNISNAGKELVLEEEYNTSNGYLELNTSYLNHQNLGELVLEVTFESGDTYNLYINVVPSLKNATLSSTEATYDISKPSKVSTLIDFHCDTFLALYMNSQKLVMGKDYSVGRTMDSMYIFFSQNFLKSLPVGVHQIDFNFVNADIIPFTINVTNSNIDSEKTLSSLKLDLENTTPAISNTISTNFNFTVSDNDSYDLSKLKIRYYYTTDGMQGENANVDNASITYNQAPWYQSMANNVKAQIVPMKASTHLADTYLELSFTGNEVLDQSGKLTLNTRINKTDWSNYDQSNDWSYSPTRNVCVYYDEQLIIGDDPVTSECSPN